MTPRDLARQSISVKDGREDLPIFIYSELDDYGLSLVEFRVYGRLARRCGSQGARESVPNMAKAFGVSDRTIQRALRVLTMCRVVRAEPVPGCATVYWLNPLSKWEPSSKLAGIRIIAEGKRGDTTEGGSGDMSAGGDTVDSGDITAGDTTEGGGVTPQTDEGTPPEGTPRKDRESVSAQATALLADYERIVGLDLSKLHLTVRRNWKTLIEVRLREEWSPEQIRQVWQGCKLDRWPDRAKFSKVPDLLGTPDKIQHFINLATLPKETRSNGKHQQQPDPHEIGPRTAVIANRDYSVFAGSNTGTGDRKHS